MKISAVIMAGGKGERFWPMSRSKKPKQFLPLASDSRTMIQQTVDRIRPLVAMEDILVATNDRYCDLTQLQLPDLPMQNILCEPQGKNTAPCIGLAAAVLQKRLGDCVMVVLSSDHVIVDEQNYLNVLKTAVKVAQQDENIVTVGIEPTYPETGYGYIHFDAAQTVHDGVYSVRKFVEKPNFDTAQQYIKTGEYLWNSGMFVFKVSTIMEQFKRYMPNLYAGLLRIADAVDTIAYQQVLCEQFEGFKPISIDYGVMEHAKNIYAIPGNFGWDDVGSWTAVGRIRDRDENKNAIYGEAMAIDTHDCTIYGGRRMIATMGLEDLVIVDTDDVLMVVKADQAQKIKSFLEALRNKGRDDLL